MGLRTSAEALPSTTPQDELPTGATPWGSFNGHWRGDTHMPGAWDGFSIALEKQVQNQINLWLPLKSAAQAADLGRALTELGPQAHEALASLRTIPFARFLFAPDYSGLWVITVFDGDMDTYLMDFVGVLGEVFDAMFVFIKDAPPLPVKQHARAYVEWVKKHSIPGGVHSAMPDLPLMEVIRLANRG